MKKLSTILCTLALLFIGVGGVKATETLVYSVDYSTMVDKNGAPFWAADMPSGASVKIKDGLLVIENTSDEGNNYDLQLWIGSGISTIEGHDYKVKITYKTTAATSEGHYPSVGLGDWGNRPTDYSVPLSVSNDFQTVTVEFKNYARSATGLFIMWQSRKVVATISIQKVEVYQVEPVAPTRATDLIEEVATSGSTFNAAPYTKFSVTKVPELAFSINSFSMGEYDDFIIDIAEPTTVGDWLICNVAEPYAHSGWWETISPGTSGQVKLGDDHKSTTSLVLQAGDPDGARDIFINDVYFYKEDGNVKYSILSTLGGQNEIATTKGAKAFEITDVNVAKYNDLVLTFSSPTVGTWTVSYDETSENIPAGSTTYTVDVRNLSTIGTLTLSVGAGDFPRYNNFKKLTLEKHTIKTMDALANDAIFSFDKATGYDEGTKTFSANGGWTFDTPVDISDYKYLFITTAQSFDANHSIQVTITDDNGKSIGGDSYKWEDSGIRGGGMWLDNWNHKNVLCLNLQYLEEGLDVDITKIKSLKFGGNVIVNNVVLSNYASSEFVVDGTDQWHTYSTGDYQRQYEAADLGKFGTICLPYKAISAGAFIYKIASSSASAISLERVDGILEAGKPYFYKATDNGYVTGDPAVNKPNVNFFRADWTGSVAAPIANNGLIGTFSQINAPTGDDYYVLATKDGEQKLFNVDAGATGEKAVKVGANKAYIDLSQITNASSRGTITINFDETTGINTVAAQKGDNAIYSLSGQRVSQPRKGLYILNGKKIFVR